MDENNELINEGKRLMHELSFLLDAVAIGQKTPIKHLFVVVERVESVMEDIMAEHLTGLICDHPELAA